MDEPWKTLTSIATAAIAGGGTAILAIRSWVTRMEDSAKLVSKHETQLTEIKTEMKALRDAFADHATAESAAFNEIKDSLKTLQKLPADIAYLRGWVQGREPKEA